MNRCNFCGYKADYIEEYTDQKDISKCLCGACLNEYEREVDDDNSNNRIF